MVKAISINAISFIANKIKQYKKNMETTKSKIEKEFLEAIVASVNEFQSRLMSERIKKGLAHSRRSKMASKPSNIRFKPRNPKIK